MTDTLASTTLATKLSTHIEKAVAPMSLIYQDLHQNPELSMQEFRTSKMIAQRLKEMGFAVTEGVGNTGIVAILENGEGATVMLRADMDALPITEKTDLPYKSCVKGLTDEGNEVGVMHACGHDAHMTCLLGASQVLATGKAHWQGTLMIVFQPSEEDSRGARSMVADGITSRFPKPDVILAQHIFPMKSGLVACRSGQFMSSGDSIKVTFFGRGSHASQPQNSIDPIVMMCAAVMRIQTIVSREINPLFSAVVTIGEIHGGVSANTISDQAYFTFNIRTTDEAVRDHILSAIRRICLAEAKASNADKEPLFEEICSSPLTVNEPQATEKIMVAFSKQFGNNFKEAEKWSASEDFTVFARAWNVPSVLWLLGGSDPELVDKLTKEDNLDALPGLHSPFFAPVLLPTLQTGIETFVTAAGVWLKK